MAERPLQVLILGLAWPPETFIARLIQGLLAENVIVTVATSTKPDPFWLQQRGFHWLFTPHWKGSIIWRFWHLTSMIVRSCLRAPKDIIRFAHGPLLASWYRFLPFSGQHWDLIYFPWNSAAVHYLPLFDLGMPVVISCRGSQINVAPHDPQRTDFVEGLKVTLAKATAVHCVSEAIKQEAMNYGLEPQKAWIIRPAVDPDFFCPPGQLPQKATPLHIITTGSLIWRKGYEYALLAVRQLVDDQVPVCLDIIGDGRERQRVLYTIQDLGLQEVVHIYGRLAPEQVRDKLQQAHVFLLASLSEGISNAVLEAMACGLPIVTTDCGGMREAVTDGVEGFVVPVRDPQAIARAIYALEQQPDLRYQMGCAGRKRIERDFRLSQQSRQFQDLFLQAAATNGASNKSFSHYRN